MRGRSELLVTLVEAHKSEALWVEVELYLADWSVTMLSNNEVSNICHLWIIGLVVAWAVNKADDIGISR
jgi:uncharacterized membrane protein